MRCICCNKSFQPAILYNPDLTFHSFETYCPSCISASEQEATEYEIQKEWATHYTDNCFDDLSEN